MTAIYHPAPGSEFDEFLYASIAEEYNGTLLSMLSVLARSNLDPWDEAARLAKLPRAAARQFLTTLIVAIPEGPAARGDPEALVERLIALLPTRAAPTDQLRPIEPQRPPANSHARTIAWAFYIAAILFMAISQWLAGHPGLHTNPAGAAATTAPATASPHAPAPQSLRP
jgi:hypothetical protein